MSSTTFVRRFGIAGLATGMALTCAAIAPAHADSSFFTRTAGADRYETAVMAATAYAGDTAGKANPVDSVIIADGEQGHYADALAASYLSGNEKAPVLLTHPGTLPDSVQKFITDHGVKHVFIVGGTNAVNQSVQDGLVAANITVTRLAGENRYQTDTAVINQGDTAPTDTAIVATGQNFPDALGGGPLAYAKGMPLALTAPGDIDNDVVRALKVAGIDQVIVLGGTDAVSDAVIKELGDSGITLLTRINGANRAETSTLLDEYEMKNYGFSGSQVDVASGDPAGDGADALGAAPVAGKAQTPLLITQSSTNPGSAVLSYLSTYSKPTDATDKTVLTSGVIFGGVQAVTEAAENQMLQAVGGGRAEVGGTYYGTVQQAIDAAKAGDTINVYGTVAGFNVTKDVTVNGVDNAKVTSGIQVSGVDGVTIKGLTITPSTVAGTAAGIYLDNAEHVTIANNTIAGTDKTAAGVINATAGDAEVATIQNNTFTGLRQGVFANPSATFTITSNQFSKNQVGSANDAVSTITGNSFVNNSEGVGMSVGGSTVTGNSFANNSSDHVGDYTATKEYDLTKIISDNSFDEPVKVTADDTMIVDAS